MSQTTDTSTVRQKFLELVRDASGPKEQATLATAQQEVIAYYYDMMKAMVIRMATKAEKLEAPDPEPVRKAITEINRSCTNQKKPFLFKGNITQRTDLFKFASSMSLAGAA